MRSGMAAPFGALQRLTMVFMRMYRWAITCRRGAQPKVLFHEGMDCQPFSQHVSLCVGVHRPGMREAGRV